MSALLISLTVIAGVAAFDVAFIPAAVIVLAVLWTFWSVDRRSPLVD